MQGYGRELPPWSSTSRPASCARPFFASVVLRKGVSKNLNVRVPRISEASRKVTSMLVPVTGPRNARDGDARSSPGCRS